MVTTTEIALLALVLLLLFGAYLTVRAIKPLVVNAIVGVVILVVANVAGLGVAITPIAVLVCAVGGVPGAILVTLLAYFDVAFAGMVAPLASLALVRPRDRPRRQRTTRFRGEP
jgi:hypothetical protein